MLKLGTFKVYAWSQKSDYSALHSTLHCRPQRDQGLARELVNTGGGVTWAPAGFFPGVGKLGIWERKSVRG